MALAPPGISSDFCYVYDIDNGVALYEKNPTTIAPNSVASTVKLMTALLIVERKGPAGEDVLASETVEVAVGDLVTGTSAGLDAGDVLTWEDLLHGILLPSGNDAFTRW